MSAKKSHPQQQNATPTFVQRATPDALAILLLYLVTFALFFHFIVSDVRFTPTGDLVTARTMNVIGKEIAAEEGTTVALWNPYVFLGMPMYSSLSYFQGHLLNPMGHFIEAVKYLFGFDPDRIRTLIAWYFASGLFMYLLARGLKLPIWAALLAGLTMLLNPYDISLAEAAHGSKLWTIAVMPLVVLTTHWILTKRRWLDLPLFALAVGSLLLARHTQIAYYALLVSGVYALVYLIAGFIKKSAGTLRALGLYAGGGVLGLLLSAHLYLPVYAYTKYSIRGMAPLMERAGSGGGLDWDYATNWSLHPLESLQFLVPGLFGVGGSMAPNRAMTLDNILNYNLYWGYMPFTQSSLYMGIVPLVLAILAAVLLWKHDTIVRWMTLAGGISLVVAFGRFFPVFFAPLYYGLPFFDKFRIPSMSLVVTTLAVAILAGYGIAELVRLARSSEEERAHKRLRILFGVLGGIALLGVIVGAAGGNGPGAGSGWFIRPQEAEAYGRQAQALITLRYHLFAKSLLASSLVLGFFSLAGFLAMRRKGGSKMLALVLVVVTLAVTTIDLFAVDRRFLHPVPSRNTDRALASRPTVDWLQSRLEDSKEQFRIFPLGNQFQSDYWMYHHLESIGGYSAVKTRVWQDLSDYALGISQGRPNMVVAGMMNARYVVSPQPLPNAGPALYTEPGGGLQVYANPFAMSRAWFANSVMHVSNLKETMEVISGASFNPRELALVAEPLEGEVQPPDSAATALVPRETDLPSSLEIKTSNANDGFLVVSDLWYPKGWSATLDGEPVKIYRADYGLRGVYVPAGEHVIRMVYAPSEVKAGFLLSWVSLVAIVLILLWSGWVWYRGRPEQAA